jgi:hypothetical protein
LTVGLFPRVGAERPAGVPTHLVGRFGERCRISREATPLEEGRWCANRLDSVTSGFHEVGDLPGEVRENDKKAHGLGECEP